MDQRQTGPTEGLAAGDWRIARAKALVVRQEILVARLAATGGDVATGRAFLEEMRSTLAEMYRHRRLILGKGGGASAGPSWEWDQPLPDEPARPDEGGREPPARVEPAIEPAIEPEVR